MRSQLNSPDNGLNANAEIAVALEPPVERKENLRLALILLAIGIATVAAYSSVLFNFFAGDDFVHLTWLRQAMATPDLIWRNFHSSWLDGTTTKFYRPLISIFMVTDYLIWKNNGLGFHLTNLVFHISSAFLLFGVVRQAQQQLAGQRDDSRALLAAAIFALYPLHPEAVSWITGRVDTIVTTFCLASVWSYLRWRESARPGWLLASLSALVLGLLSKEMAITVPAVIVLFELLSNKPTIRKMVGTTPFWAVLAGYFVVRRIALGTFVGGYDDSLLFIANFKEFLLGWLHGIRMLIVPINKELIGSHHLITKVWECTCVVATVLGAWRFINDKNSRRPLLFALGWLVLSLLPVYKVFAISDDLQGSRFAYLATVPLSVLFAYGVAGLVPIGFLILCACILWMNNQPWREAGNQANAIQNSLQNIYSGQTGDPQTILIGVPDQYKGAYISRNAIWGMTKFPQLSRDISNIISLNQFEPVHPVGFLKESIAANSDKIHVYRWSDSDRKFLPVNSYAGTETGALPKLQGDGELVSTAADAGRPGTTYKLEPASCWNADFVRVDLDLIEPGTVNTGADFLYENDINPKFQLGKRTHCDLNKDRKQTLLFSVHSLPEWMYGTSNARLKLLMPPHSSAKIERVSIVAWKQVIPTLSFANCGVLGTKGYLHLGADKLVQNIDINSSAVTGAASSELEITRANLLFEEQNGRKYSAFAREHKAAPLKGKIELLKSDFASPGIYELRVWAKDARGERVGLASDHIVIAVDP